MRKRLTPYKSDDISVKFHDAFKRVEVTFYLKSGGMIIYQIYPEGTAIKINSDYNETMQPALEFELERVIDGYNEKAQCEALNSCRHFESRIKTYIEKKLDWLEDEMIEYFKDTYVYASFPY